MRKYIDPSVLIALVLVAAMSFIAWYLGDQEATALTGRYLQASNGAHIVIDEAGTPVVLTDRSETGIFKGLSAGDKVLVSCSILAETYPARAVAYFCMPQEEGHPTDLPSETLSQLVEMKWLAAPLS